MHGAGALIRRLRLERNFSQEGLAKGICAASYLSKIEQGQVEAGAEIIDRLFEVLGVSYCRNYVWRCHFFIVYKHSRANAANRSCRNYSASVN